MNDQHHALQRTTGAYLAGDPAGHRQFARVIDGQPFHLEGGAVLSEIDVAYETWGELNAERSNAILVCHALTGDSHAHGSLTVGHKTSGWWEGIIGPHLAIDTNEFFVVCSNVLGGCQGTTGPASTNPATQLPYGSSFPVITMRDIVRVQEKLSNHLGIDRWLSVVGGSMGGMQALEWAVMFPNRMSSMVCIASAVEASAQQIAWSLTGRRAILLDPYFNGGDYYDNPSGVGPSEGLALARNIAQIHYRSEEVFTEKFGRNVVDSLKGGNEYTLGQRFDVEGYLDYHGMRLVNRFDANSYLRLNKAMDLHDISRGRGSLGYAIGQISVPTLVMSIRSDMLYPPKQQQFLRDQLQQTGVRCGFFDIDSREGHDGFLLETQQMSPVLRGFINGVEPIL